MKRSGYNRSRSSLTPRIRALRENCSVCGSVPLGHERASNSEGGVPVSARRVIAAFFGLSLLALFGHGTVSFSEDPDPARFC